MGKLYGWWRTHRKAVVAYAGALLTVAALVVPQSSKWYTLIPVIASALGVHLVPNDAVKRKP